MALYLGWAASEQLEHAQAEVDRHVASGADGRCLCCGQLQPCAALLTANTSLVRYGRLPVRRPGLASRALRVGVGPDWFGR